MSTEEFTEAIKYCLYVRPERIDPVFLDEPGTIKYQVEDGDFQRFVDSIKKPYGQKGLYGEFVDSFKKPSGQDMLMKQLCYAQPEDRLQTLAPVLGTMRTKNGWFPHMPCYPYRTEETLYLYERRGPSVFDIEFSSNGLPFIGYLQKHRDDYTCLDESCVGAVAMKGKILLRESTPICVPNIAMFSATLHRGVLRIVRHHTPFCLTRRGSSRVIYADINMTSSKQEFERGIRTVNKLRMAAAEFRESVAASVGDPSTYDVAPDDWMPLQERSFSFPEARTFSESLKPRSDGPELSDWPGIGYEEYRKFKRSRWTAGSDSLRIFAKYAFDHQPPTPPKTNIPLSQLGLDPADPKYEPYNGYVPPNFYIMVSGVDNMGENDCHVSRELQKLITSAVDFVDFTENVTQLVEKKLPCYDNLAAFVVEVSNYSMDILMFPLRGSRPSPADSYSTKSFWLGWDKERFEVALRALARVRKIAAEIRRRLCEDVAARRRPGEIHVPAQPDRMEVSRSEDEEICKVNDTMARIDLGTEVASREPAPVGVETNTASQRGQKRGRDDDDDETPQTTKHRRTIKAMPQARLGADAVSVGLAAIDIKADPASQDDQERRRDEDDDKTPQTMEHRRTTKAMPRARLDADAVSVGLAAIDIKADPASQDDQKRRRDEDEGKTPRTVTTGTMLDYRPDASDTSVGPAATDIKADPASQDGQKRKRDEDEDEGKTPRTVTTGTWHVILPAGRCAWGAAPAYMKANSASQDDLKRRRDADEDKGETPRTVTTGTWGVLRPAGGYLPGGGSMFGASAPAHEKSNFASQDDLKRRRDADEDKGETPRAVTTGTWGVLRPAGGYLLGGGSMFGASAPAHEKSNSASQDDLKRRRDADEDKGETPRAVTTGNWGVFRPGGYLLGGGMFGVGGIGGGPATVDKKANVTSQSGLKRRRDEEEDEEEEEVSHSTEKNRRPGVNASSRKKVKGDHVA